MKQFTLIGTRALQMKPSELADHYKKIFSDLEPEDEVAEYKGHIFTYAEIKRFQEEEYWEDFLLADRTKNYINRKLRLLKEIAFRSEILSNDKKNPTLIKLFDTLTTNDKDINPTTHYSHFHLPRFSHVNEQTKPILDSVLARISIDD